MRLELLPCSFTGLAVHTGCLLLGDHLAASVLRFPCAGWILGEALLSNEGVLRDAPQSYKTSHDLALLDIC